jgi:hypothetical protein
MRYFFALVLLCFAVYVTDGTGAPVDGAWADKISVGAEPWKQLKRYRAGERASVQIVNIKDTPISTLKDLIVTVFDPKGTMVAQDKGNRQEGGNFLAVLWYPPREGEYRVEVRNDGGTPVDCYVTVK